MDILVAHNFYKLPGGEDQSVAAEITMLEAHGHNVVRYFLHNEVLDTISPVQAALRTVWSRSSFRDLQNLIRRHKPQIVHFHNTFPLISPAAYYAARAEQVPVVQTIHNFRLLCANALLFRNGVACEDCVGKSFGWPAIVHKCYRGNAAASGTVATMITTHWVIRTWRSAVDVYVALTDFSRRKLSEGGLPAARIAVKPNFLEADPGPATGGGGYALCVGRLSPEKGTETLLDAWRHLGGHLPLKVVGDGPMAAMVQQAAAKNPLIEWLGWLPRDAVSILMGEAEFLIVPSACYETFARVIIEAYAKGTPVVASKQGAMAELIEDQRTGLHFGPGNAIDLAEKVRLLVKLPQTEKARMRQAARTKFMREFTASTNYPMLMTIYERACRSAADHHTPAVRLQ
jgi:glycosyltransferase involved in cell wall biosynthesis